MLRSIYKLVMGAAIVSLTVVSTAPAAFASSCTVNGEEVPCDEWGSHVFSSLNCAEGDHSILCQEWAERINSVVGFLGGTSGGTVTLAVLGFVFVSLSFIFWASMVAHAIRNDIDDKAGWILFLMIWNLFGAFKYYRVVKRPFDRRLRRDIAPLS